MYKLIFLYQVLLCRGFMDSLCIMMNGAKVFMACMCSDRSCPCCWCPDFQLDDTQSACKYRKANFKKDPNKWSVSKLDNILQTHQVSDRNGCSLQTLGCLEWESKLYRGIMRARCYPFNMRGHHFHNINPQVHSQSLSHGYTSDIPVIKKL